VTYIHIIVRMNIMSILQKIGVAIMHIGMPLVLWYHALIINPFINIATEDAKGFEKAANIALIPTQYILAGKIAYPVEEDGRTIYRLKQRFDYNLHFWVKTGASFCALSYSLSIGTLLKAISYLDSGVRKKHQLIKEYLNRTDVVSNKEYYEKLGLDVGDMNEAEWIDLTWYKRRPGDENHLAREKEALKEVFQILKKHNIPCWVDCGTCLGAYRYGGVIPWDMDIDIAILEPDFENVRRALNELDKDKYEVQDWSNRCLPNTYLKIFVKQGEAMIDIYHFAVHPENKTVQYILSNEYSIFLPESWRIRERRFTVPMAYDTVFPLKKALFDGIEVFVPNKTKKYLQSFYGENIEPAKVYDENTCQYEKDLTHPYWNRAYVH